MYTNYTLDDIMEILGPLGQSVDEPFRHLEEKHKKILHLCREELEEMLTNKELQSDVQKLIEKQCTIQIMNKKELEQNSLYLQNLENTIEDLKKEKLQKENELLQLEKEVNVIKKKLQSTLDDRNDISSKNFNPQELTQEEITKKLWDLVLEDNK